MTSQFPRIEDERFRQRVCSWLRANGVDPNRTPMYPQASVADGQLTLLRKVRIPPGNGDVIDPANPNEILTETITVPVVVPPTDDIAEWLECRLVNGA